MILILEKSYNNLILIFQFVVLYMQVCIYDNKLDNGIIC